MYKTWKSDETLEQVKLELIREVREDDKQYYVFTSNSEDDPYDDVVTLVNKGTKEISCMSDIDFMLDELEKVTTEVDINRFRKEA